MLSILERKQMFLFSQDLSAISLSDHSIITAKAILKCLTAFQKRMKTVKIFNKIFTNQFIEKAMGPTLLYYTEGASVTIFPPSMLHHSSNATSLPQLPQGNC